VRDVFVEVQMEFDSLALAAQHDPSQYVIEAVRAEADLLCDRNGAKLRTDRAPELIVKRAQRKDTGASVVTVDSRWACSAPEDVPLRRQGEPA
jgi:hypothetical protein